MKNKRKKLISTLLSLSIIITETYALAEELVNDITDTATDLITVIEESIDYSGTNEEISQNELLTNDMIEYYNNAEITTENLPFNILNGDEDEAIERDLIYAEQNINNINIESNAVSTYALTNTEWKNTLFAQLGDEYLSPYKPGDGVRTSGYTNRLIIEETDLYLPGKNGLDLQIKRKYDNQYESNRFSVETSSFWQTSSNRRYLYYFTDVNTNDTYCIAVEAEDDFYTYLHDGCYLTEVNPDYIQTYTNSGGDTYNFYMFEYIYNKLTDDTTAPIHLVHNESAGRNWISINESEGTKKSLYINKIFTPSIDLGNSWSINLPEVYTYRTSLYSDRYDDVRYYERKYQGAFRDINGEINTFSGTTLVRNYDSGESTFSSTYNQSDSMFYKYTSNYTLQTIADTDIEYNFKVSDNNGYTYYFYCPNLLAQNVDMSIRAIENDYGDMIVYSYNENNTLTSITDTYGRVINIIRNNNQTVLSYNNGVDETNKTIIYNVSEPDTPLINDSPLKARDASMFSVTNENGETTKYYSRPYTQVTFAVSGSTNYMYEFKDSDSETNEEVKGDLIEKIKYPNGLESNYKYTRMFARNGSLETMCGVYVLIDSYDKDGDNIINHNTYSVSSNRTTDTVTTVLGNGQNLRREYDKTGKLKKENIQSLNGIYTTYEYIYNYANDIEEIEERKNTVNTTEYTYRTAYGNLVTQKILNGKLRVKYQYHEKQNGDLTNKIKTAVYENKPLSSYEELYTVTTTLTADEKEIETETITVDNIPKAKKKYTYDNDGNIIKTDVWVADTNEDGILDENDEIISYNSSTQIQDNGFTKIIESITGVTDADGINPQTIQNTYYYDIYGNPVSYTDSYNNTTSIEYDAVGRITGYNYSNDSEQSISYNVAGNYTVITDTNGSQIKNTYNVMGQLIKKERLEDDEWVKLSENTYDNVSRLSSATTYLSENKGKREEYTYNKNNRMTVKKVYELPGTLLYTENYSYSHPSTTFTVTTATTASDGTNTSVLTETYNRYEKLTTSKRTSGSKTITYSYGYDQQARLVSETLPDGGIKRYTYDCMDNVLSVTDEMENVTTMTYDMAGRMISQTDAKGNTTSYTYDKASRKIMDTLPQIVSDTPHIKYYYDNNSRLVKQATEKTQGTFDVVENVYDVMDNVTGVIQRGADNDVVTIYNYDISNRLTGMRTGLDEYSQTTTGGALTSYSYDQWGNITSITDAAGRSTLYSNYDYAGNPQSITDRNGNTTQYTYGIFGQTQAQNSDGTITTQYNNLGYKTSESMGNITENYSYDAFGRMTQYTTAGTTQTYTYDNNSNITSYEFKNESNVSDTVNYTYNDKNQLTQMNANGIITTYGYDANGNLTSKTANNGLTTTYTYNNVNLITGMTNSKGETVYNNYQYQYYLNGNKSSEVDNTSEMQKLYSYDEFGQLVSEVYTSPDGETVTDTQYTYDRFGNRTSMNTASLSGNQTESYTYDLTNRMLSKTNSLNSTTQQTTQYTYDNNGNQISETVNGTSKTFTYNKFNQLTGFSNGNNSASYTYNPSGARRTKTMNGTTTNFVWNGSNLAYEKANGKENYYYYDITGITSAKTDGVVKNYLKNSHGDVTAIADSTGTITNDYFYDAFGNEKTDNAADTNPFRYCGEYFDAETGQIYLRNRYYDPSNGRFISEDPVRDGYNWYVYCGNDPVMFVDPSGNIREPGYVNGVWCEDPDAYEFGKDSLVYDSLTTLGEMWELRPNNRADIESLANEIRRIAREFLYETKLKLAMKIAPNSANSTDIILAAGHPFKAAEANKLQKKAGKMADERYTDHRDGTLHNAFKHTIWNAMMAYHIDPQYAKWVGDAHEFGASENLNQTNNYQRDLMNMDLHNNEKGIQLGDGFQTEVWYKSADEEMADKIIELINEGELWIVQ